MRDLATGGVIGSTRYHDIDAAIDRVEIGYTWYAKSRQRSHINTACKLLLLSHAFARYVDVQHSSVRVAGREAASRHQTVERAQPMIASDLVLLLVRELETVQREVEMCADDAALWHTQPGVTNSVGNLAAHLAGNVQHFIGAVLGKSGYVRNRDYEFSRREGTRAEIMADLQAAIDAVTKYLPAMTDADFAREYPEAVGGVRVRTSLFLMHLASHAAFHLGQADYLRRTLNNDARTAGTLPLNPLSL